MEPFCFQGSTLPEMPRPHHHVYVVELSRRVLDEPRFMKSNPHYSSHLDTKPCVYVGMTGLQPDERFDKHKAGVKANRFVREYGLRLLPELYEVYNPMPYEAAREMEVELAIGLREAGYAVWQA
ncbi:MAG: hypothetical protein QM776_09260 [Rhodocyclaceae bacterium]